MRVASGIGGKGFVNVGCVGGGSSGGGVCAEVTADPNNSRVDIKKICGFAALFAEKLRFSVDCNNDSAAMPPFGVTLGGAAALNFPRRTAKQSFAADRAAKPP
jgi:hypothetical protein